MISNLLVSSPVPYIALAISLCAFLVALKNYRRKAGMLVRGSFTTTSSAHSSGTYVSSFIIENLKDRAITIFAIYLQIGSNYYIEIDDFEKQPLILKAFETLQKNYGPIEFYGVSNRRLELDGLFADERAKKRLVLSAGDGRYVVPSFLRTWDPVIQMFKNHMTAVVRPVRSTYKGQDIGGNIKFAIEFVSDNGREEIVPIHPKDYEIALFKDFTLTPEALESKSALEAFLHKQIKIGKLACKSLTVIDMQQWRERSHKFYSGGTRTAPLYNPFRYYIVGRAATIYADWKLRRQNARRQTRA